MIHLGFVSAILPELSFEAVVDAAADMGYEYVEIMCWPPGKAERRYAGITHIDVTALDDQRIGEIHQYLKQKNVKISALGYYPNPMDEDNEQAEFTQQHIQAVIHAAHQLGIPIVNTFIGRAQSKSVAENLKLFEQTWPPIVAYAEERDIKIGIENCPMYFTRDEWPEGKNLAFSPAIWRKMFDIIPSAHFGLNYDPSHLLWMQMDYIKPIYAFKDRLVHIHIKDAQVYPDKLNEVGILAHPLEYHSPKLPGLGDINWGKFFSALNDIRYDGPVCVEVEDKAYEHTLEGRRLALLQSSNYLRQFVSL